MTTLIVVDTNAIDVASDDVAVTVQRLRESTQTLDSGNSVLAQNWTGTASLAHATTQAVWDGDAATSQEILTKVAQALRAISTGYTTTERALESGWS